VTAGETHPYFGAAAVALIQIGRQRASIRHTTLCGPWGAFVTSRCTSRCRSFGRRPKFPGRPTTDVNLAGDLGAKVLVFLFRYSAFVAKPIELGQFFARRIRQIGRR